MGRSGLACDPAKLACSRQSQRCSTVCRLRRLLLGKRELVSSAETSRVQGKRYDWSQECGFGRWGCLVSRSVSCAGDVQENGRVLENKNGECESPA